MQLNIQRCSTGVICVDIQNRYLHGGFVHEAIRIRRKVVIVKYRLMVSKGFSVGKDVPSARANNTATFILDILLTSPGT